MANDFIDDSSSLAIGVRPEEMGMGKGDLMKKASFIKAVKDYTEQSEGGPLGSETLTKSLRNITQTIVQKVQNTVVSATKAIVPSIESELYKIGELLKTNREDDDQKALDIIDNLQQKFGVNLKNFSKELNDSISKLEKALEDKKQKRSEEKQIREEKISQLETERVLLQQNGVIAYVDKENLKLKIRTNEEVKKERITIREQEKQLERRKEQFYKEEQRLLNKKTLSDDESKKIQTRQQLIQKAEDKLQQRKDLVGVKPGQTNYAGGPISETLRGAKDQMLQGLQAPKELFVYFKSMGKEISGLTSSLGNLTKKGLAGLGRGLSAFGSGLQKGVMTLGRFVIAGLMASAKYILIGLAIVGVIMLITKLIDWVKSKFSWLFGDDKKKLTKDDKDAKIPEQDKSKMDKETLSGNEDHLIEPKGKETLSGNEDHLIKPYDKEKRIKPPRQADYMPDDRFIPMSADERNNITKLSKERNMANKEKEAANNMVIAPTNNVSTQNQNSSVSFPMEVDNYDRSFRNIGTSLAV
jgi:hypothetical protein